jgi:hypothetical protein
MKASPPVEISASLINKHDSFLISAPENFPFRIGISARFYAAFSIQSLALQDEIVPVHTTMD